MAIRAELAGALELKKALAGVDRRTRKKALQKGVRAATKLVLRRAKDRVRRRTGLLAKALGQKVKQYRGDGPVVGLVGPRTGFRRQVGVRTRGASKGKPFFEDPVNIAHLVEKGTSRSRAFPFLRPALDESKAETSDAVRLAVIEELHK